MSAKLRVDLNYATFGLITVSWVTMGLTFVFAALSEESSITSTKFYISSAWRADASRSSGNWGIPLTSLMISILICGKYLQLREAVPHRSRILRWSLLSGLAASLLLIGACAITVDRNMSAHLAIAGLCFTCACISLLTFHIAESRSELKGQSTTTTPSFLARRVLLAVGLVCGVVLISVFASPADSPIHFLGSLVELIVGFCILASAASFGSDLCNHRLEVTLVRKS
jgi:Frag1/DRAM/Sfk1 family